MPTFILSDESINVYGTRVITSGIDLTGFRKNPVMMYEHDRNRMPIGRWENIRIEENKLLADAVFDDQDVIGAEVKRKVDGGFLNAVSIGFDVLEVVEELMIPGQYRPTITKADLLEASIVDIPANRNAVRLSFPNKHLTLSAETPGEILDQLIPKIQSMKNVAVKLGLPETAPEATVIEKITSLQNEIIFLKAKDVKSVDTLIALGKTKGLINDKNEADFRKLAGTDYDSTLNLIHSAESKPEETGHQTLSALIRELKLGEKKDESNDRSGWTYLDWAKNDSKGLENMQKTEPEKFQALVAKMKK